MMEMAGESIIDVSIDAETMSETENQQRVRSHTEIMGTFSTQLPLPNSAPTQNVGCQNTTNVQRGLWISH